MSILAIISQRWSRSTCLSLRIHHILSRINEVMTLLNLNELVGNFILAHNFAFIHICI